VDDYLVAVIGTPVLVWLVCTGCGLLLERLLHDFLGPSPARFLANNTQDAAPSGKIRNLVHCFALVSEFIT